MNFNSDAQCAAFKIEVTGAPIFVIKVVFEMAAVLVECTVNIELSTPASVNCFFIHPALMNPVTGLCGFTNQTRKAIAIRLIAECCCSRDVSLNTSHRINDLVRNTED